jgi:hypothetical protein
MTLSDILKEKRILIIVDNIDTRSVLDSIRELVSRSNVYIRNNTELKRSNNRQLLKNVAAYITRTFDVLGLIGKNEEIGFPAGGEQAGNVRIYFLHKAEQML